MRKIFIWALIAGVIFGILGNVLFNKIISSLPSVLVVGIYFAVCTVVLILFLFIGNGIETRYTNGAYVAAAFVLCVVLFFVTMAFEFIYEFDREDLQEINNNYVFMIDNSGSMESNDPNYKRYEILNQIISELPYDAKIGVFTYASDVKRIGKMGTPAGTFKIDDSAKVNDGNTYMLTCADTVADEIIKSGENYNIINLTDGIPSDARSKFYITKSKAYKNALKKCEEHGIKISSVGFGNPDSDFLIKLADSTGGIYMEVNSTEDLYSSLNNAISATDNSEFTRTLISVRQGLKSNSILYAFLRILFLSIIGIIFSFIKTLAASEQENTAVMIVTSAVFCIVGALLIELCTNVFGVSENLSRIIFCVLWSVAISPVKKSEHRFVDNSALIGGASAFDTAKKIGSNGKKEPPKSIF